MSKKKTKKNYQKSYIKCCGKTICVDELTKAVNLCDKEYGIKLKHHDVWANPANYREIIEAKADMNIAAIICIINGVEISDYFETDKETNYGTISKPVGVKHDVFTDSSYLMWNDEKTTYNTDSLIFRCRFVTLVLSYILGRIDKITYNESLKRYNFKHSRDEHQIVLTKKLMDDLVRFTLIMINSGNKYQNIILKINEYLSYSKRKVKHSELRNLLNGHVIQTRSSMKKNPFGERFATDDMTIYQTLKISYMLATNKTNLDVIPKFKYIEHATVKHDLIKLIEDLGADIIESGKSKKYSPMFRAFIESRPFVCSQFYKEAQENVAIQTGLFALAYTKFIFNDDVMTKFINEMLKKGK